MFSNQKCRMKISKGTALELAARVMSSETTKSAKKNLETVTMRCRTYRQLCSPRHQQPALQMQSSAAS